MALNLLSDMNRLETPFIEVEMGGVTFGLFSQEARKVVEGNQAFKTNAKYYPNFMKSLSVTKVNGAINTYILNMTYMITPGDDPNLLEYVFSKAKKDRTMFISYGDLSLPTYIYKREEALITDIKSNPSFSGSKISYTIYATSKSLLGNAAKYNFQGTKAKASDIIKNILYNEKYRLLDLFYGMRDKQKVLQYNLIPSDDVETIIQTQTNMTVLEYIKYLVTCMSPNTNRDSSVVKNSAYRLTVIDDTSDTFAGPYFKITKLSDNLQKDTIDVYNIDIGYPDKNVVIDFNLDDNQVWSLFYDYANDVDLPSYIERIDNKGNLINEYSPAYSNSKSLLKTTAQDRSWWTNMINYPVSATLKIKGLIRPAILMNYVYINAQFYGKPHISTGYYIITKQVDDISEAGYRTTLSLSRVGIAEVEH